jgi:signal transduction histidine kinase/CheY-like chemotaxis protein
MSKSQIHDLQLENLRFRKLFAILEGGVLVEDETRHIILINQAFCDMFGIPVSPTALVGSDCSNSADSSKMLFDDPDGFVQRIDTLLQDRQPVIGDTLYLRDGRVFSRDYMPVYDEGTYIGHLWHYHDVTQITQSRRRFERLLKVEEVNREIIRLFLQLENVDLVVNEVLAITGLLLDVSRAYVFRFRENVRLLDNTHEWCAPGVKPEIENLKGLPFDDLIPSFFPLIAEHDLIAPYHIRDLPDDLREILEPQDIQSVMWVPLYLDNRIEGFLGYDETRGPREWLPEEITMARFVSKSYSRALEREQATRMLIKARDEALRVAQLRAQFVANMSHEIRTPMTGTLGMLELLMETELDDLQREFASDAYNSSAHLLELINEILDFSKLEAGQVILESSLVDLTAIATEIKMTLAPQVKDKPVTIRLALDSNIPYRLYGDPTRIRQVLMNMMGNAVKFTQQGEVVLAMSVQKMTKNVASIVFSVEDTGIGIAPDNFKRIFDSFVQADGSTTRRFGGTGLGLSISKQLVELMGGHIEVESTLGKGSRFFFELRLPVAQMLGTNKTSSHPDLASLHVLVIDSNRTARYVLAQQLESWGVQVFQLADMESLVGLTTEKQFDVAFMRCDRQSNRDKRTKWLSSYTRRVIYISDSQNVPESDAACLTWPIDQSSLYNALIEAAAVPDFQPGLEEQMDGNINTGSINGRVLLAEDHAVNSDLVRAVLSRKNIQVDVAKNGLEVLACLEKAPYDLVLMDIHMPVMDGLEATRRIRASTAPYHNIPILALTASVMSYEQEWYRNMGINETIPKPFSIKQLREAVAYWLQQSQQAIPDQGAV